MTCPEPELPNLQHDAAVHESGGHYSIPLSPEWCVWSPQGGYLMAVVVRAAGLATELPLPLSLACHFLSVPRLAAAELQITSLRRVRTAESLRVTMTQDGRPILEALVWTGEAVDGYAHTGVAMPEVPRVESLAATKPGPGANGLHTLWKNLEQRPCGPLHWERTAPSEPRQRDWVRLRNFPPSLDAFLQASRYALLLDTFTWPAAAHAHVGDARFISPTLSFSIDFHSTRSDDWLLSDAHSPHAGDGRIAIHDRLWTPTGELVASGTATMTCRPRPAGL
jgi:acyl-CoA thioesterase II